MALDAHSPAAKPIVLAGHRSRLYVALSGPRYVGIRKICEYAARSGETTHDAPLPCLRSIAVPVTKVVSIDQLESVIVDHVGLHPKQKPQLPTDHRFTVSCGQGLAAHSLRQRADR